METLYQTIDTIIAAQKKARQNNDFLGLLVNGEALLEYLYKIILHEVEMEKKYRIFEAQLALEKDDNGKRNSSAFCETQAKAQDAYIEWRKAEKIHELIVDMVNMAKKLASSVDNELKAR